MEMRTVTEPGTEAHRWLTMIEGCPLSAAPPELLTETLNPLTVTDERFLFFFFRCHDGKCLTLLNSRI